MASSAMPSNIRNVVMVGFISHSARYAEAILAHIENEVVAAYSGVACHLCELEQQRRIVDPIARVAGLIWKVELRRQHALLWRLHLDVEVAGAAGIEAGHDGLEHIP